MPARWLVVIGWVSVAVAFVSAGAIVYDIFGRRYRQRMGIMEAVWPITALYFAPLAVWAYAHWGRPASRRWLQENDRTESPEKPAWAAYAVAVSHCGAGCTLGDIVAEFAIFGLAATFAGETLFAEYIGDYAVAVALGLVFQYFAIAPMRGLGVREGLVAAAKADILSLSAFEVGLFGWMALMSFVFYPAPHHLHPNSPVYWLLMQVGMIIGFGTAYPINVWLVRRGVKEAM